MKNAIKVFLFTLVISFALAACNSSSDSTTVVDSTELGFDTLEQTDTLTAPVDSAATGIDTSVTR